MPLITNLAILENPITNYRNQHCKAG